MGAGANGVGERKNNYEVWSRRTISQMVLEKGVYPDRTLASNGALQNRAGKILEEVLSQSFERKRFT